MSVGPIYEVLQDVHEDGWHGRVVMTTKYLRSIEAAGWVEVGEGTIVVPEDLPGGRVPVAGTYRVTRIVDGWITASRER